MPDEDEYEQVREEDGILFPQLDVDPDELFEDDITSGGFEFEIELPDPSELAETPEVAPPAFPILQTPEMPREGFDEPQTLRSNLFSSLTYNQDELGQVIFDDYVRCFQNYSQYNDFYAWSTFHLLMGQLPNIKNIKVGGATGTSLDARVHVVYFSPSGTGKGEGANVVARMSSRLGLKYQEVDEVTTAGLIGTVYLNDDGETETEYGWLHPNWGNNILAATEAGVILNDKPRQHAENVMDFLQKCMNTMGTSDNRVSKKLSRGPVIEFNPECSLFLTTYPTTGLRDVVVSRGILQRTALIVNDPDWKTRLAASFTFHERSARQLKGKDVEDLEVYVAKRLLYIDARYRNVTTLPVAEEAEPIFKQLTEDLFKIYERSRPFAKVMFDTFVSRYDKLAYKFALHYACLNLHKKIEVQDAAQGCMFVKLIFQCLVEFLENKIIDPPDYTKMYDASVKRFRQTFSYLMKSPKYQNSRGWVLKSDLVSNVSKLHQYTEGAVNKQLEILINTRVVETRTQLVNGRLIDGCRLVKIEE